jgi:hypothetical protein
MVLKEHSQLRMVWDLMMGVLILVTCVLVPYQIAFQHEVDLLGSIVIYSLDLIFLVDIILNFRTTYRHYGTEIEDRAMIRSHYLRTMFAIDLLATVPLDLLLLLSASSDTAVVSMVLFLRLFRLLRVVRLVVIFSRWMRQSSTNTGLLRIARLAAIVVLLTHWISCAWFLVPFVEQFPADSWVATQALEDAPAATQYVRSLYWTVVTMTTVGYGDITPARNIEYVFAILVMLAGASLYAYIIGNIASLLSNLDAGKAAFWNRADAVHQYLRSRHVPSALNEHIRGYYEYLWARYHGLTDKDMFAELPQSIRITVLHHLTGDLLNDFALFREAPQEIRNELLLALEPRVFAPGDYLLRESEFGTEVFFLSRGTGEIRSEREGQSHGRVSAGDYFGHLSMLLGERRSGCVIATSYCETFVLLKEDFERIRSTHPGFRDVLAKAASMGAGHSADLLLDDVLL